MAGEGRRVVAGGRRAQGEGWGADHRRELYLAVVS